jgi:hypothetical protein
VWIIGLLLVDLGNDWWLCFYFWIRLYIKSNLLSIICTIVSTTLPCCCVHVVWPDKGSIIHLALIVFDRPVCLDGVRYRPGTHQEPANAAEHPDEGAVILCPLPDPSDPWGGHPARFQLLMTRAPGKDVICVENLPEITSWYRLL